jgi:predicted metal-dependent peptidase
MPISVINVKELSVEDRLTRARIQLNKKSPFFSYLVLHLEFEREDKVGSIGVDKYGRVYYNEKFIRKLNDEQLMGILAHEVSHIIFEHMDRRKTRKAQIFNVACDIIVNNLLVNNGFELLENGLIPNRNSLTLKNPLDNKKKVELTKLDRKIAEGVYKEIEGLFPNLDGEGGYTPIDEHIEEGESTGEGTGTGKIPKGIGKGIPLKPIDWKKKMTEAYYHSKNAGITPMGIERHIEGILHPKRSYYEILYRYIVNEIPYDYSYSYPSKKSHAIGVYLPHTKKEHIEMVAVIDTSGSINAQTDLKQFLEGIVDITKSFQSVKMTILSCDTQVHSIHEIDNGSIDEIMKMKLKGGGGTKFTPAFKWINENKPTAKLVIFFTDGFNADGKPNTYGLNVIWLLTKNGSSEHLKDTGLILEVGDN